MAKFGLDFESLQPDNPELVYCSISGFGQSGPHVNRAAYAPIVHAASGFDSVHAQSQQGPNEDEVMRPSNWEIMVADILTGSYAFGAIQTALLGRERQGGGGYIDVSMMESMMTLIPAHIQSAQMEQPALIGRFFPVKVKDGFVMACVVSDKNLECLAAALGRPDLLVDPRFVRGPRTENFYLLAEEIERWSVSLSASECEEALNRAGVPCSLYQQVDDLFAHPQVVERNSFASISDDVLGDFLIQNMPFKLSGTDSAAASWAAKLGEHTNEILSECLHLKPAEIGKLRSDSVVS